MGLPIDPATVSSAATALTAIANLVRSIVGTAKKTNNTELTSEILELQAHLLEVNQQLFDLQTENYVLKEQLKARSNTNELRSRLAQEDDTYWLRRAIRSLAHTVYTVLKGTRNSYRSI